MDIFHINVKCKLHEGSNLKVSVYIKLLSIFFSDDPALPPAGWGEAALGSVITNTVNDLQNNVHWEKIQNRYKF